eukprot:2290880-Alexandrium_andersonii.AAC.1
MGITPQTPQSSIAATPPLSLPGKGLWDNVVRVLVVNQGVLSKTARLTRNGGVNRRGLHLQTPPMGAAIDGSRA